MLGQAMGVNGTGIFGLAANGIGVAGTSGSGAGAFLDSISGIGFQGRSSTGVGVIGSTNNGAVGGPATAYAAQFYGGHGVQIFGNLEVSGTKSAIVPHPDGDFRAVYCLEAPESFFEDFGDGQLVNGSASVRIDRDFAAIVNTTKYHVFLTAYGPSNALNVTRRTQTGFEISEAGGGRSSIPFGYRIVAPRRDVQAQRLRRVRPDSTARERNEERFDETRRRVQESPRGR
jgi:hypothetical protein